MEHVQKLLGVLSCLTEQRNALGIPDVGRCAGGVHDHGAAVAARTGSIVRIIIVPAFGLFCLTLLGVTHDHLVDLTQHLRRQPLMEVHHQGGVEGRLFIVIAGIPAEVLQVWVLLDLKRGFLVGISILRLNDTGTQSQPQWLGHIAFAVGKQSGVPRLSCICRISSSIL